MHFFFHPKKRNILWYLLESPHKTTENYSKCTLGRVCPEKTQINLLIIANWSLFAIYWKKLWTICRAYNDDDWSGCMDAQGDLCLLKRYIKSHHEIWASWWYDTQFLWHESHNKGMKHSCKKSFAYHGIRTQSAWIKIKCSNHRAKESTPWRSCQSIWFLCFFPFLRLSCCKMEACPRLDFTSLKIASLA